MRRLAGLIAAVVLAGCATAQPEAPELSRGESSLADVQIVTSPGGITAWLVSENFVPMISMEWTWAGGASVEPDDKRGIGWVTAYMMNEGAGDMGTSAYGARMEDLNMRFACGVWADWTNCGMTTLKETADESFDMVRLAYSDLRLDDEPFERAKREMIVGLQEDETNPKAIVSKAMNDALIPGHPYARSATEATVSAIGKADSRNLIRQLMTKDRLKVVVVGDITAEELKPKLDLVFGSLPATSTLPVVQDAAPLPAPEQPIVKELPQPQTLIMFSGPGIRRDDPDFYAAYVLNYILGGGAFSSRLTDDVREKRGLTYGIGTALSIQPHMWRWQGSSSTMNDKAGEVVELIRENIGRLGREGPTPEELADAKAYITGAFPLAFDSNAKIAQNLLGFQQDGMPADYVQQRNSYFEAVTLADVKRVAAAYMKPDDFTFVMVGQPTK
ncbi:MAG TPA: pitrilysin family protein [Hyphomonadaceae bacterium]|nr:pitrilysin family protein [Hyphomonadaceae bacterium]HPI49401.1 pitrilysin family protein [Hyphomonadaceae bacterium]